MCSHAAGAGGGSRVATGRAGRPVSKAGHLLVLDLPAENLEQLHPEPAPSKAVEEEVQGRVEDYSTSGDREGGLHEEHVELKK